MKPLRFAGVSSRSMTSFSRPVRVLTLLLLALQCALPALISVADGARAQAGRHAVSHMEAVGATECTPAHSADCELCQFLASGLCAPLAIRAVTGSRESTAPVTAPVLLLRAAASGGFHSRAPPATTA